MGLFSFTFALHKEVTKPLSIITQSPIETHRISQNLTEYLIMHRRGKCLSLGQGIPESIGLLADQRRYPQTIASFCGLDCGRENTTWPHLKGGNERRKKDNLCQVIFKATSTWKCSQARAREAHYMYSFNEITRKIQRCDQSILPFLPRNLYHLRAQLVFLTLRIGSHGDDQQKGPQFAHVLRFRCIPRTILVHD